MKGRASSGFAVRFRCLAGSLVVLCAIATPGLAIAQGALSIARPAGRGMLPPLTEEDLGAALDRLEQWVEAVRGHEPGTADAQATLVASWSDRQYADMVLVLELMLFQLHDDSREARVLLTLRAPSPWARLQDVAHSPQLQRLRSVAALPWVAADPNGLLHRGARLHTDVGIHQRLDPQAFRPFDNRGRPARLNRYGRHAGERVVVSGPDGEYGGMQFAVVHWDLARTLLSSVFPNPSSDPLSRAWYRAVGAYMLGEGMFGEAKAHFGLAEQYFPDDVWLAFGEATMQAAMAAPPLQDFVRLTRLPGNVRFDVDGRRVHLQRAQALFRRVLSMDPGLVEAQIRLGQVRLDLGEPADAVHLLEAALQKTTDVVLSYYGHLFLGHAYREMRRVEPARASFLAAAQLFPRAQTPRLALSELAHGRDRAEARAALEALFALGPALSEREDPWWDYHDGEGPRAEALLADLDRRLAERRR
jgi:tetratricopeptide (TPR) repeat protein